MKTAIEILNETVVNGFKSDRRHELTIIAMQSYALQVAEAVRDECARIAENANTKRPPFDMNPFKSIDLTTFIK